MHLTSTTTHPAPLETLHACASNDQFCCSELVTRNQICTIKSFLILNTKSRPMIPLIKHGRYKQHQKFDQTHKASSTISNTS